MNHYQSTYQTPQLDGFFQQVTINTEQTILENKTIKPPKFPIDAKRFFIQRRTEELSSEMHRSAAQQSAQEEWYTMGDEQKKPYFALYALQIASYVDAHSEQDALMTQKKKRIT